jgi:hypothetical protein
MRRIPALTMLLETALVMDHNSRIKSNDPSCSPIDKVTDITKMTNVDKHAATWDHFQLQWASHK